MISRRLIRTDLNLLVVLQVLLEEHNVTRAAERLSVSQPAMKRSVSAGCISTPLHPRRVSDNIP